MQKVVGSNPIIRFFFSKAPLDGAFCCLSWNRRRVITRSEAGRVALSCRYCGQGEDASRHSRESRHQVLGELSGPLSPQLTCLGRSFSSARARLLNE